MPKIDDWLTSSALTRNLIDDLSKYVPEACAGDFRGQVKESVEKMLRELQSKIDAKPAKPDPPLKYGRVLSP